jgi:hypothetical protein
MTGKVNKERSYIFKECLATQYFNDIVDCGKIRAVAEFRSWIKTQRHFERTVFRAWRVLDSRRPKHLKVLKKLRIYIRQNART